MVRCSSLSGRQPVDPSGRRERLPRVDVPVAVGVDRAPRPDLEDLVVPAHRGHVGAESAEELGGERRVVPAVRSSRHRLAVLRQLVAHADARGPRLEVEDVAGPGAVAQDGEVVEPVRRGREVVDLPDSVLGGHVVEAEPEVDRQAPGGRPLIVEEGTHRVAGAHREGGVDRVFLVVEHEARVAVPGLHVLDALGPAVRVEEVDVVLEVAALGVAPPLRVLDAELEVVLAQEPLGIVREVALDGVPARVVGLDVGEGAVDAVAAVGVGPLPPVDVARVAGSVRGDVGRVVRPEAQPLGGHGRLGAAEPLPLRGHGVVLRLGAVRHRRIPARQGAPAPRRCSRCSRSGRPRRRDGP